ncbi:MAG: hypothetical protein ACT4QB_19365 [Gammaproteobacteria bacterium]
MDGPPLSRGCGFLGDRFEGQPAAPAAQPLLPSLREREDDRGEVGVASADEGEAERVESARGGGAPLLIEIQDEGVGRRGVFAHLLCPGWRRRLEDVGVGARAVQQAVGAGGEAGHAHGALQGMAEDAAPGGARKARQAQMVNGPEREPVATERQRDAHSLSHRG